VVKNDYLKSEIPSRKALRWRLDIRQGGATPNLKLALRELTVKASGWEA